MPPRIKLINELNVIGNLKNEDKVLEWLVEQKSKGISILFL